MSEPKPLLAAVKPTIEAPRLWSTTGFVTDLWAPLDIDDAMPERGQVILPLERWRAARAQSALRHLDIGIAVSPGEPFPRADDDLTPVLLVALAFTKFSDGRAYSIARRLRAAGFRGEVRATGDVLLDQIALMQDTGFDAFEIVDSATLAALERQGGPMALPSYQRRRA